VSLERFDLTGRTAIVTGASRGLGQIFGRALAKAGADLVVTSRDLDSLTPFCHEIEELGRKVLPSGCAPRRWSRARRSTFS
jgi:short-subunit dehydrogenase